MYSMEGLGDLRNLLTACYGQVYSGGNRNEVPHGRLSLNFSREDEEAIRNTSSSNELESLPLQNVSVVNEDSIIEAGQNKSHSSRLRIRSQTFALTIPQNAAKVYAQKTIVALNSFDSSLLRKRLQDICSPNVKITKNIYSVKFSIFESRDFVNLLTFSDFMEAWHGMIPDGYFEAFDERIIVNSLPTFVFISFLSFRGHKLVRDVDLLRTPFDYFPSYVHDHTVTSELAKHNFVDWECHFRGSLVTYVNPDGKITALELYLSEN